MANPQQPELRRSARSEATDDATKERLTAPSVPGVDAGDGGGPVPADNQPGHHPPVEQDKPSGRDFVAKTHALAQEDSDQPPTPEDEVLDLTQVEASHDDDRAERLAHLAGKPFAVVGSVLSKLRDRLP